MGFKFNPNAIRKLKQDAAAEITKRAKSARCPVHGQLATVKMTNADPDNPQWEVAGCCEEIKAALRRQIAG